MICGELQTFETFEKSRPRPPECLNLLFFFAPLHILEVCVVQWACTVCPIISNNGHNYNWRFEWRFVCLALLYAYNFYAISNVNKHKIFWKLGLFVRSYMKYRIGPRIQFAGCLLSLEISRAVIGRHKKPR